MRYAAGMTLAAVMIAAGPHAAAAQERAGQEPRAAIDGVEFLTGVMDFDLSGTGKTMPFGFRVSKALSQGFAAEFTLTLATPEQQFGSSWMSIPEGRLSYAWRLGRVRPYVSGGLGTAVTGADTVETRWRLSMSGGGGARVLLNDRVYAIGEMRLRGISRDFSGTTAEWLGGIGWAWQ